VGGNSAPKNPEGFMEELLPTVNLSLALVGFEGLGP
jgi:hypothetical protein